MIKKTALITGGNRGIGLATVQKLSALGFKVYMGCRSEEKAQSALREIGMPADVIPLIMELESEEQIRKAYESYLQVKEKEEKLDVLINNAASGEDWIPDVSFYSTFEIPYSLLEKMYRINVLAPLFMLRTFLPSMQKGSRVVNVASGAGELRDHNAGKDFQPGYAPTKAALIMMTKKMAAAAYKSSGVIVNCCNPGWCRTATGSFEAPNSPEFGADSIIDALFLNETDPPYGKYWQNGKRILIDDSPDYAGVVRDIPDDAKLALWGAGGMARMLMEETDLAGKNIVRVYDSDPYKHGKVFCGKAIEAFNERDIAEGNVDTVLITVISAQQVIGEILEPYKDKVRVITLERGENEIHSCNKGEPY